MLSRAAAETGAAPESGSGMAELALFSSEEGSSAVDEDELLQEEEPLSRNVYGWAVSVLIRDTVWFDKGTKVGFARASRILNVVFLVFFTMTLQAFILVSVWNLLCARQVDKVRMTYDAYEQLMYPNHTFLTVNGFHRGIPGHRQDENFLLMDSDTVTDVCEIAMSHPCYLISIVLVWTLTCQVELRNVVERTYQLLAQTPTVTSLSRVLIMDGGVESAAHVEGLTLGLKLAIAGLIQLPQVIALFLLLWLGCRWLTATVGLGDVLLNGVALEFVLMLDDLLYKVCSSTRNQMATENLFIRPFRRLNKAGCCTFFDAQLWGLMAGLWSVAYVFYFQRVLPDFRWDIHDLCLQHLESMMRRDGDSPS